MSLRVSFIISSHAAQGGGLSNDRSGLLRTRRQAKRCAMMYAQTFFCITLRQDVNMKPACFDDQRNPSA
jgi:hypothetical protein